MASYDGRGSEVNGIGGGAGGGEEGKKGGGDRGEEWFHGAFLSFLFSHKATEPQRGISYCPMCSFGEAQR